MQTAIKYSKMIAWSGIILNVILLFVLFILYHTYFDSSWIISILNVLKPIAVIAETMMLGGIVVKSVLELKSGIRKLKPAKWDIIYILLVVMMVVLYNILK